MGQRTGVSRRYVGVRCNRVHFVQFVKRTPYLVNCTPFEVLCTVRCRPSIICYSAPFHVIGNDPLITASCGRNRSSQLLGALSPLFSALLPSPLMSAVRGSHACYCRKYCCTFSCPSIRSMSLFVCVLLWTVHSGSYDRTWSGLAIKIQRDFSTQTNSNRNERVFNAILCIGTFID